MTFLRAYLDGDEETITAIWQQIDSGAGLAMLVHTAFVIAARRMFAPTWTRGRVVAYVARVRALLSERPELLDPRVAEHELLRALGDQAAPVDPPAVAAPTQLILLSTLVASLNLDETGIDELLGEARAAAETLLSDRPR